jgi:hypothetical protein
MNIVKLASAAAGALALGLGAGAARADVVNFDEFTSPPVTCCYIDTGVSGPLVYAHVTIEDAVGSGFVMNGDGWDSMQTSGDNLFGSKSGSVNFNFSVGVSGLNFDLINGTGATTFTIKLLDAAENIIGTHTIDLGGFGDPSSVGHLAFAESGIRAAVITGNNDIAVDTIGFNAGNAVPEPATWALMIGGFGLAGVSLRRRKAVAA